MKKNILFVLLATLFVASPVFGQEIPMGSWYFEPASERYENGAIALLQVTWTDTVLRVDYSPIGRATNLSITVRGKKEADYRYFAHPNTPESLAMTNIALWNTIAKEVYRRCKVLDRERTVDTEPFTCIGVSIVTESFELGDIGAGGRTMILKNGYQLLAIKDGYWKGHLPDVGSNIFVGRDTSLGIFFPVEKSGEKYLLEMETVSALDAAKKDTVGDETARFERAEKAVEEYNKSRNKP